MNAKKVTIKAKLILLASTLVLLLFIVGAFSMAIQRKISYNENIKLRFKNILIGTLELRKAEKDFMLSEATNMDFFKTGKSKFVLQFDSLTDRMIKNIGELKHENLVEDNNFDLDELSSYYITYKNKFHELVDLKFERGELDYGLIGQMRAAIHTVEKDNKDGLIENQILMLRRTEKDFLLRKDMGYASKLNDLIGKLLRSEQIPGEMKDQLEKYKAAFNGIVSIDRQIGFTETEGMMGELKAITGKVEPAVDKILAEVDDTIAGVGTASVSMISIFLFIGLAVAVILSFLVIRSIIRSMRYAVSTLEKIANGDLNVEIDIWNEDEIGILLTNMKSMAARLKEIVTNIQIASLNITAASTEMNASAQQMSEGATEQASSVEQISASMEEMAANIQQSTDNSLQTEKIAKNAAKEISESNQAVHKTVSSMKTIEKKISIIGEIARQTNLLALNAAVEAARAGEHGRGFAVVAAEVRKLAERSQHAAVEINDLAYSNVEIAQHSGELLNKVVPDIQRTADLVQEIAAASVEQNAGSVQVNSAIQQLNQVVQSNAATAEELAATAQELNAQSEQLKDMIGFFNIGSTIPQPSIRESMNTVTSSVKKTKTMLTPPQKPAPATVPVTERKEKQPVIDLNLRELIDLSDKDYERF